MPATSARRRESRSQHLRWLLKVGVGDRMLRHLWNENELVGEFVAALIPHCRRGFGANIRTLGVLDDDQLIAGVVYHNWDVDAGIMEISGAATHPRWLSRRTLMLMHCYPFGVDCKCQMVVQR